MGDGVGDEPYEEYSVSSSDRPDDDGYDPLGMTEDICVPRRRVCGTNVMPFEQASEGWYCSRSLGHEGPCAAHPPDTQEEFLQAVRDGTAHLARTRAAYLRRVERQNRAGMARVLGLTTRADCPRRPGLLKRLWFRWVLRGWRSYDHDPCADRACRTCRARDALYGD